MTAWRKPTAASAARALVFAEGIIEIADAAERLALPSNAVAVALGRAVARRELSRLFAGVYCTPPIARAVRRAIREARSRHATEAQRNACAGTKESSGG